MRAWFLRSTALQRTPKVIRCLVTCGPRRAKVGISAGDGSQTHALCRGMKC